MKKILLIFSLVLVVASCGYGISGKVKKDAGKIVEELLKLAEEEDVEGANDLFGEILDKYKDPWDAQRLAEKIGQEIEDLSRDDQETLADFFELLDHSTKCKNFKRFSKILESEFNKKWSIDSMRIADSCAAVYAAEEAVVATVDEYPDCEGEVCASSDVEYVYDPA